jgi:predicted small integral membrane protein
MGTEGIIQLMQAFAGIAGLLCDMTVHLDANYFIQPANGIINDYFKTTIEDRSFLDIVSSSDRANVELVLQDLFVSSPVLMRASLLCEEGAGQRPAKILVMGTSSGDHTFYTVGVRLEDIKGLSVPRPPAGVTPSGSFDYANTRGFSARGSVTTNYTLDSASTVGTAGTSRLIPLPGYLSASTSSSSAHLRAWTEDLSRGSLSCGPSFAPSSGGDQLANDSPQRSSLRGSISKVFSGLSRFSSERRGTGKSTASSMSHKSKTSLFSLSTTSVVSRNSVWSTASRRNKGVKTSEVQTESVEMEEKETQTDSTHIPAKSSSPRPPVHPASSFNHKRSSHSSSSSSPKGKSRKSNPREDIDASSPSSAESNVSCNSQDLVISHFQATEASTIMVYVCTMVEHINARTTASSCCTWHATVHAFLDATKALLNEPCRPKSWLPYSGWQCQECLALNDVDEGDCAICFGDRTP